MGWPFRPVTHNRPAPSPRPLAPSLLTTANGCSLNWFGAFGGEDREPLVRDSLADRWFKRPEKRSEWTPVGRNPGGSEGPLGAPGNSRVVKSQGPRAASPPDVCRVEDAGGRRKKTWVCDAWAAAADGRSHRRQFEAGLSQTPRPIPARTVNVSS